MPSDAESQANDSAIWKDDLLGRSADAEFIADFLLARTAAKKSRGLPRSFVLNVDSGWGRGKTFFLSRFAEQLKADGRLVAAINAWEDDHADDPMLSVLSAVQSSVAPHLGKKKIAQAVLKAFKENAASLVVAVGKGAAKQLSRRLIGDAVENVERALFAPESAPTESSLVDTAGDALSDGVDRVLDRAGEALLAEFKQSQQTLRIFRESLTKLLTQLETADSRKVPLFVLVDELDRCRPPYAIAMLERIKHIFDTDGVVFVIATNNEQLHHAISAVYGSGFDATSYLGRFFDSRYEFAVPNTQEFIVSAASGEGLSEALKRGRVAAPLHTDAVDWISQGLRHFDLPLREIERCIELLTNIVETWNSKGRLQLAVVLPLVIGHVKGLPLALTREFSESLESKFGRSAIPWRTEKHRRDASAGYDAYRTEETSWLEYFSEFAQLARMPLSRISERSPSSAGLRWVVDELNSEFSARFNNTYASGTTPMSILSSYPEVVRSVGRLGRNL